eukprot:COSAG02_NODE_349_length_24073_cov_102.816092_20_plen_126_part_00
MTTVIRIENVEHFTEREFSHSVPSYYKARQGILHTSRHIYTTVYLAHLEIISSAESSQRISEYRRLPSQKLRTKDHLLLLLLLLRAVGLLSIEDEKGHLLLLLLLLLLLPLLRGWVAAAAPAEGL